MKKEYVQPEWTFVELNGEIDTLSVSTETLDGIPEGFDGWTWF